MLAVLYSDISCSNLFNHLLAEMFLCSKNVSQNEKIDLVIFVVDEDVLTEKAGVLEVERVNTLKNDARLMLISSYLRDFGVTGLDLGAKMLRGSDGTLSIERGGRRFVSN